MQPVLLARGGQGVDQMGQAVAEAQSILAIVSDALRVRRIPVFVGIRLVWQIEGDALLQFPRDKARQLMGEGQALSVTPASKLAGVMFELGRMEDVEPVLPLH